MTAIPLREITPLLRVTAQNWLNDRAQRLGAALAFYNRAVTGAHSGDPTRNRGPGVQRACRGEPLDFGDSEPSGEGRRQSDSGHDRGGASTP